MDLVKCPSCGSTNVILETDVEEVKFFIGNDGEVEFEPRDIRNMLNDKLKFDYVECECADCGENWIYNEE